jgi:ABC-type bacteriocin/lantibiotic exporter with double-glycine peptidase domain
MVYLFIARIALGYIGIVLSFPASPNLKKLTAWQLGFRVASTRISASMRLAYLRALFNQPISVLDTLPPGQTAAIITTTANVLQVGISEKLSMLLQSCSLVVTALIIAFHYNWLLTLITSSGLLFIVIFYCCTIPFLVKGLKEVEHADRMSSSIASETFGSIRMVAACGAEEKMARSYSAWVDESRRRGFRLSPLVATQQAPGQSSANSLKQQS